ncbi:MAG: dipeptidase PepV [Alicyclobacillus sp.]|nr:dipeptidase PepV [Alicyclobacillus sp.]
MSEGLSPLFQDFIEKHRDRMIASLQGLLQIPSVEGEPAPGKPFGEGPAAALQYVLQLAEDLGLRACNVDGYAGHAEYGEGPEYVAVLGHLDVVPAGGDWTYPPFGAEIHDGKVYARGAVDDKGPVLSSLWALAAVRASGVRLKHRIRVIFGLDEESGWRCVQRYFQKEPLPIGGFSPDAEFPLIFAEKGVATVRLRLPADRQSMCPQVIRFEGGQRVNMVPDYAYAVVDCHSETEASEWEQELGKEARQRQVDVSLNVNGSLVQIVARGRAAHGSTPEQGVNAITALASLLGSRPVANASMWRMIGAQDTAGKGLGIDAGDDVCGPLTSNLGRGLLNDDAYTFWFNIRYPLAMKAQDVLARCRAHVSDKWEVSLEEDIPPLHVPLDSPVVQVLSRVYEERVGQVCRPIAIGGATFARAIPNAVAFGPLFPGQEEVAHQPDEYWAVDDFLRCTEIYAHAMYELANTL